MSQKFLPGDGTTGLSTGGGFTINTDTSSSVPNHPFKVSVSGNKLYVEPGMIRSLIPCLGSSSVSNLLTDKDKPSLTITGQSNKYIYIRAGADDKGPWPKPTVGDSKYPTIFVESSLKTDDVNYGYILIASLTYSGGYKVNQMIQTSLYGERHKLSETQVNYYIWRV